MRENGLKAKLRDGRTVFGTFVQIPAPAIVEIAGAVGLDYVIIDMQHGPFGLDTAASLIRAADAAGMTAVVRVPTIDPALIGQVLDAGALGVAIPELASAEDARRAVAAAKYPPHGTRSACSVVRGVGYHAGPESAECADRETLVRVSLEGSAALDELDEVVSVDGIDVICVGTYDLSFSLGVGGERTHPLVVDAVRRVLAKAQAAGKWTEMLVHDADEAAMWAAQGVRAFSLSLDVRVFYDALATLRRDAAAAVSARAASA